MEERQKEQDAASIRDDPQEESPSPSPQLKKNKKTGSFKKSRGSVGARGSKEKEQKKKLQPTVTPFTIPDDDEMEKDEDAQEDPASPRSISTTYGLSRY